MNILDFNAVTVKHLRLNLMSSFLLPLAVVERGGAYMPLFNGDSYVELKGLHLYNHDLR